MGVIGKLGRWMAGTALGLGIVLMPIIARADGATTAVRHCSLECTPTACCTVHEDGSICDCCWKGDPCDVSSGGPR